MLEKAVTKLNKAVFGVAAGSHLVGLHLNNIARVNQGGWNVINAIKPTAVVNLPGGASVEDIARILTINPDCHVFIRPYYVPEDNEDSKERYIQTVESMIRGGAWNIIPEGQRHLQLFNEQNMPRWSQYEGFGIELKDMILFDKWFCIGYDRVKQIDPSWKIGWTPLTPGNRDVFFPGAGAQTAEMFRDMVYHRLGLEGKKMADAARMAFMAPCDTANVPYYMHGLEAAKANPTQEEIRRAVENGPCYESLKMADEYLAHIYCMSPEHQIAADWAGLRFVMYAKFFPKAYDVWIPECGIGGEPEWIVKWYTILQSYSAVKGTAIWKLGAEIGGVNPQVAALREYTLNLPPTLPQPIPWPEPVTNGPPDPPLPVPDFTAEPLSGVAPFEVQFTNLSEGGESCRWFFWDNEQSTVWNPIRTYANPGEFNVTLRVWPYPNEQGEYVDCRKVNYITVLSEEPPEPEPPVVDFYGEPTSGIAPLTVQFYNTSEGDYYEFRWNFGDGNSSFENEPTHVYAEPGLYTVTLTLWQDDKPYPLTKPAYIEVLPKPEPEPPQAQKYDLVISGTFSGTVTLTKVTASDELPIDADISRVSVVEENGQLYVS